MKVWCPYIQSGSGSDVFTESLAQALTALGCEIVLSPVKHYWQFCPWAKSSLPAPEGTEIVLANSWNAFAFQRRETRLVVVEHLFVHDPAFAPFRSHGQALFHQTAVRYFENASFRAADAVVAVSKYTADAVKRAFPAVDAQVIHNGVDTTFFCPETIDRTPVNERPIRLLFVGNLSKRKGADLLPEIMRCLGPGYELRYTSGLRTKGRLVDMRGLIPQGRLDRRGARDAYRHADILLLPTRLEGLPLTVLEAMACGTPVIASSVASLPEVVEDGVTGRLCPAGDVEAFAKAVRDLAGNPDLHFEMARNARAITVDRFDIARMGRKYLDLFERL